MKRTVLTIAAVADVVLVAALWWGGGSPATTFALVATLVIATVVVLAVVWRSARPIPHGSVGSSHADMSAPRPPFRVDEFRDRGDRFGPP